MKWPSLGHMQGASLLIALAFDSINDFAPIKVDPDAFTNFMSSLQPPLSRASLVSGLYFDPQVAFNASILAAVTLHLKSKKSPGPYKIRTESHKLEPRLFFDAAFELWRAVGHIGFVPSLFRCGLLSPIYRKGRSVHTNQQQAGVSDISVQTTYQHCAGN